MLVEAQHIVEWLSGQGDLETAFDIEGVLPPHVDTDNETHRALLTSSGVDVDAMLTQLDSRSDDQAPAAPPGSVRR